MLEYSVEGNNREGQQFYYRLMPEKRINQTDHEILLNLVQLVNFNHQIVTSSLSDVKTDIGDTNKKIDTFGGQYATNERTNGLDKRIEKIEGNFNWFLRIVAGIIIAGAGTFMLKGGLNL